MIDDNVWEDWQEQGLFKNRILHKWLNTWELGIKHQRGYSIILLLRGVSCILMKNSIMIDAGGEQLDTRIPIMFFSDSGSGKGMGSSFYQDIFKKLDLKIISLAKPTPEKMVGSFNDSIHNENTKRGFKVGDEKYRSPIIHGYFELYDDIIFDESDHFFKGTDYGEEMLRKFRMALDTYGSSNNLMKSETLKNQTNYAYHTKANIMLLSYHIDKISKQILNNGIFQRSLCLFYHLEKEEMNNLLNSENKANYNLIEEKKQELLVDLKKIKNHIENLNSNIKIDKDAMEVLTEDLQNKLKDLYNTSEDMGRAMQTFLPRLKNSIIKLACSLAILRLDNKITKRDMEDAVMIGLFVSFESLKNELFLYGIMVDQQLQDYKDLKINLGSKWRPKDEINQIMGFVWKKSRVTVVNRLKPLLPLLSKKQGEKNLQLYRIK